MYALNLLTQCSTEISLAKFSQTSVDDLIKMIIRCDREVVENAAVMEFLQRNDLCEIPDNVSKLMAPYSKDWTGPNPLATEREQNPEELTREDQLYLYTAFELHHYWKSRMRAIALTRSFEKEYDEISEKLQHVVTVSDSIRDSVSLMNVLGLILDIGNYMNDANKQASGFKLSSLARLGMVKDDKNESTFADLVERIVRTQYPIWEGFVDEIWGVVGAQKINVEQVKTDARRYIDNISNVQMSLDSGNLSDPKKFHPEDRVSQVAQRAMKEARRKAEQLEIFLEDMTKTFEEIMAFYGEDSNDENARRDFFAKLAGFVTGWKQSREKNTVYEEARRRNEANMRRKAQANNTLTNGVTTNETPSQNTGAMDSLLEKLRAAAPQHKDTRDRRRRARLKDRHQVRVASGQKIEDLPDAEDGGEEGEARPQPANIPEEPSSQQEDQKPTEDDAIANRAANMLQGLRGSSEPGDEAANSRKRRESLDAERMRRRRRKAPSSSSTGAVENRSESTPAVDRESTIPEENEEAGYGTATIVNSASAPSLPTTIVSPPSPKGEDSDRTPVPSPHQ